MVTIKDIAKYTNISKSTISRFLNDGYVSQAKRKIIEKAIKDLNYRRNLIAKSLKTNRSMSVALILPSVTNYFFSYIAEIVQQELSKYDYKMILYTSNNDVEREVNLINEVIKNRVDGIIVSTGSKECVSNYESLEIPIVAMDRKISEKIPLIISENSLGSYNLTKHLFSKNAKKILFIESNDDNVLPSYYRKNGFIKACKESNIDYKIIDDSDLITFFNNTHIKGTFDAIMVWNDQTAFIVSSLLYKKGIKIGKEILLTGYDNSFFSEYMNPPLTTANQPKNQIGETAVKILMKIIKGNKITNKKVIFHNAIIKRESTGD